MSHGSLHQRIFGRKNIHLVPQPPIRLISVPVTSFNSLAQKPLERAVFNTLDNIQKSVTNELKGIPVEAFQHCYKHWKQRLRRCVAAQGN